MGLSQTLEEIARKTHSPQKHRFWGWSARRLSSWGLDGGIVVPEQLLGEGNIFLLSTCPPVLHGRPSFTKLFTPVPSSAHFCVSGRFNLLSAIFTCKCSHQSCGRAVSGELCSEPETLERKWRDVGGCGMLYRWRSQFISTGLYDRMQIGPLVWNLCVYWGDLEQISYML